MFPATGSRITAAKSSPSLSNSSRTAPRSLYGRTAVSLAAPFVTSVLFGTEAEDFDAVILEPVAGNMGCVPPVEGYLEGLREITSEYGTVLVFDEVMTGFRLARGGAQERFGVTPDLTCLG